MEQSLSRMIEEVLLTNDLLANETKIRKLEKEEIKEEVTGTNSNNTILQVNPNPTSGSISIEFKGNMKNAKLLIVNSIGKVVLQEQLIKKNVIKDLSGHPKGIYIVTVNKNLC